MVKSSSTETNSSFFSIPLSDQEFEKIRQFVHQKLGIYLTDKKRTLVTSRLQRLLTETGITSYQELLEKIQNDPTGSLLDKMVSRITTNYTYFYREERHFLLLEQQILPSLTALCEKNHQRDLRIWCAGCATGEEAYMLQMILMNHLGSQYPQWKAGILATDISPRALQIAIQGVYPKESLERLPPSFYRYFQEIDEKMVKVIPSVQKEVMFRRLNLIDSEWPFRGKFHIIFCRNVMIYFEHETREKVVEHFDQYLYPGGYLFIGHSESLPRNVSHFRNIAPAVYQKV